MVMLVTAAELASHLQRSFDQYETATANQAITTSSAYVENKTGMAFTARTATITLPSSRDRELSLPLRPVRSVTAVSIGGTTYTDARLTASGTLYRDLGWRTTYAPQDVLATVQYGLLVTPDDIKGLVCELSGGIFDGRLGVQSEQIDDYRVAYSGVLSATSLATLANYGADVGTLSMTGR
jgi:hypothetical protein